MYIKRSDDGVIVAISKIQEAGFDEQLSTDSDEIQHFLAVSKIARKQSFEESDLNMVRVLEDLINVLIERNLIRFTDLPMAAQSKLLSRRELREDINLLDDEDDRFSLS